MVSAARRDRIKPYWFEIIHSEFEKYGTTFREAMPRLGEFRVAAGQFSLKTAGMMQPVESLHLPCAVHCGLDVEPEILVKLKNLTLGKT